MRRDPVNAIMVTNMIIRTLLPFHFISFILQKNPFC